jgi:hypothetical protein
VLWNVFGIVLQYLELIGSLMLQLHLKRVDGEFKNKKQWKAVLLLEKVKASLRHMYVSSFSLEPENIKSARLGAIWNFGKATGLP